jgi:hypothetical protein
VTDGPVPPGRRSRAPRLDGMPFTWSRVGSWVIALVIGGVYGVAGTITHATVWGPIPVGLVIALVASAALLIAVRTLTGDRIGALAAGVGMCLVAFVLAQTGPGGSVIVQDDTLGLVWSIGLPAIVVLVVAWPRFDLAAARAAAAARSDAAPR